MTGISGIGYTGGFNSITAGASSASAAQTKNDMSKFKNLLDSMMNTNNETLSSSQIVQNDRLNGDYKSNFDGTFHTMSDKAAKPVGMAANSASESSTKKTIDKTSKLYEKSLELESYFVKVMLSSMKKTISKTNLMGKDNEYARNMYEDMMYDELTTSVTKNAGFGLADQIYLSLTK